MTQNETTTAVTRKTAVRGSNVRVTLRNDQVLTGQLIGWGAQIVELALDAASKRVVGRNWKRDSFSTFDVVRVETV